MCEHNEITINDDENIVIDNVNLEIITEPDNDNTNIIDDDMSIFLFNEEEDEITDTTKNNSSYFTFTIGITLLACMFSLLLTMKQYQHFFEKPL